MKRNNGYSLLELLVVIGIAAILALVSYESIISFQYQSQVEAATQELLATLTNAQSKSRSGTIPAGMTAASFTDTGLPVYSVILSGYTYTLHRTDTLSDMTVENVDEESHTIDSSLTVTPGSTTISFNRITGLPNASQTLTLRRGTSTTLRTITVAVNGLITKQ